MRRSWIICGLVIFPLFALARRTDSQTNTSVTTAQSAGSYDLSVAIDEVILNFHAEDAHGLPVNDLKLSELSLLDRGKPPRKVLAFELLRDYPIRAAILVDTSSSMLEHLAAVRAISSKYAQSLLRQQTDQAFVVDFGDRSKILQPWTSDPVALTTGIRGATASEVSLLGSTTALFDTLYATCHYEFGKINYAASANFIMLFSDGEDDSSHVSLKQAVAMCQRVNTAVYAFRAVGSDFGSEGERTLTELALKTGGRAFRDSDSPAEIYEDLRVIEADLRNQYRLIYTPPEVKHDGSFHRIDLMMPGRVDRLTVRSGYYAPMH
ncbi:MULTISPECIES: VWA domain-containing protein [Acidobacteriaceae]|uniref:VWA domain-containing protein n=1 Tax=Acidobacteriaceae TaxID=204434 RepID=UPI00131D9E39|nr:MULTISPECIES: VWA domain-containing protein [Acidobacteriaceae]MDW5265729.1 VWA domain-containing protein [Edaphobacter sp.]